MGFLTGLERLPASSADVPSDDLVDDLRHKGWMLNTALLLQCEAVRYEALQVPIYGDSGLYRTAYGRWAGVTPDSAVLCLS